MKITINGKRFSKGNCTIGEYHRPFLRSIYVHSDDAYTSNRKRAHKFRYFANDINVDQTFFTLTDHGAVVAICKPKEHKPQEQYLVLLMAMKQRHYWQQRHWDSRNNNNDVEKAAQCFAEMINNEHELVEKEMGA